MESELLSACSDESEEVSAPVLHRVQSEFWDEAALLQLVFADKSMEHEEKMVDSLIKKVVDSTVELSTLLA